MFKIDNGVQQLCTKTLQLTKGGFATQADADNFATTFATIDRLWALYKDQVVTYVTDEELLLAIPQG